MAIKSVINSSPTNSNTQREPSQYDGVWLNVGVYIKDGDTGEENFVRLARGIAVSDLEPKAIYANMAPDYAAQVQVQNSMIKLIQEAADKLDEGESLASPTLGVELYRRREAENPETLDSALPEMKLF